LLNAGTNDAPRLLLRQSASPGDALAAMFRPGSTKSNALIQAQALDIDQDGRTDVAGVDASGGAVFLQQDAGGRLVELSSAFGPMPAGVIAAACADLDGDCHPDVVAWSDADGLVLRQNAGNGNRAVRLRLLGQRTEVKDHRRTNLDGVGTRVVVQAGATLTAIENTTLNAGLGTSRLPLSVGVGRADRADVVRLRWPDQVPQAELNVPTCEVVKIVETNRKPTSCPVLFTWNGSRYEFITDILGGGALGESGADGSIRPARPSESVAIEASQLVAQGGRYRLKLAEPMDEVMYLDQVRLDVVDRPAGVAVYPDERFTFGNDPPTEELVAVRLAEPKSARDHRGRDVTEVVRTIDGKFVDGFLRRPWLGYAEEHFVEFDAEIPAGKGWLVLTGGTDYPYPESIYAATQAGVELLGPVLERMDGGKWVKVADVGFPAGLTKTMTFPLPPLSVGPARLRLRTNMQIFWDRIAVGTVVAEAPKVRSLAATAELRRRGFAQEITPPGSPLIAYDDARSESVAFSPWKGRLTKYGDVTTLLNDEDDRFALCGPGDEVEFSFDATKLPPPPDGWTRSFVLRSKGYCKDVSPFTVTGGEVGPLPFRGMKTYPPGKGEVPPARQADYDREWNTRTIGR